MLDAFLIQLSQTAIKKKFSMMQAIFTYYISKKDVHFI